MVYIFNVKYDPQFDESKGCTALMRSHDCRRSWGEMRLLTYDGVSEDIYPATYIYDEVNGAIVLFSRSRHWKPEFDNDKVIAEVDQERGYTYERFWVAKSFDGGIGGTYGVMPELYVKLLELFESGDKETSRALQYDLNNIIYKLCSAKGNMYAVIKAVLKKRDGLNLGGVKAPLANLIEADAAVVDEAAAMIDAAVAKYM